MFDFPLKDQELNKNCITFVSRKNWDSNATWWYWFKTFVRKISESRETNYIKMGFRASTFYLYSEVELIPSSVSKFENCGLVQSSTEVAVVAAGCIAKKVVKRLYLLRSQKMLNF